MLARSRDHVGILSAATGGDLARSTRWREISAPYGIGDELGCVATDERGSWGDFRLFRDSGDPVFDADDARLMRDVSALLARALRRGAVGPMPVPTARRPRRASCCWTAICNRAARPKPHAPGSGRSTRPISHSPTAFPGLSGTSSGGSSPPSAGKTRPAGAGAGTYPQRTLGPCRSCTARRQRGRHRRQRRAAGVEDILSLVSRASASRRARVSSSPC